MLRFEKNTASSLINKAYFYRQMSSTEASLNSMLLDLFL